MNAILSYKSLKEPPGNEDLNEAREEGGPYQNSVYLFHGELHLSDPVSNLITSEDLSFSMFLADAISILQISF